MITSVMSLFRAQCLLPPPGRPPSPPEKAAGVTGSTLTLTPKAFNEIVRQKTRKLLLPGDQPKAETPRYKP